MQNNTSFCNTLVKDRKTVMAKAIDGDYNYNTNNKKNTEDFDEIDMNGCPWPPRCYICGFCKRKFKSAQALGGHMNVHRKDRARLRSSPPAELIGKYTHSSTILNLNLKPNPNPTFVSSPPPSSSPFSTFPTKQQLSPLTTSFSPLPAWLSQYSNPPPTSSSASAPHCHNEKMKWLLGGNLSGPLNFKNLDQSTNHMKINAKPQEDGCMRLDLEIGALGGNSKDEIDLELRLGF